MILEHEKRNQPNKSAQVQSVYKIEGFQELSTQHICHMNKHFTENISSLSNQINGINKKLDKTLTERLEALEHTNITLQLEMQRIKQELNVIKEENVLTNLDNRDSTNSNLPDKVDKLEEAVIIFNENQDKMEERLHRIEAKGKILEDAHTQGNGKTMHV